MVRSCLFKKKNNFFKHSWNFRVQVNFICYYDLTEFFFSSSIKSKNPFWHRIKRKENVNNQKLIPIIAVSKLFSNIFKMAEYFHNFTSSCPKLFSINDLTKKNIFLLFSVYYLSKFAMKRKKRKKWSKIFVSIFYWLSVINICKAISRTIRKDVQIFSVE